MKERIKRGKMGRRKERKREKWDRGNSRRRGRCIEYERG